MNGQEQWANLRNIKRFSDILLTSSPGDQRETVQRLLLAEEDRFGLYSEKVNLLQQCMARTRERIERQEALLDSWTARGGDPLEPQKLLDCLRRSYALYGDNLKRASSELDDAANALGRS